MRRGAQQIKPLEWERRGERWATAVAMRGPGMMYFVACYGHGCECTLRRGASLLWVAGCDSIEDGIAESEAHWREILDEVLEENGDE